MLGLKLNHVSKRVTAVQGYSILRKHMFLSNEKSPRISGFIVNNAKSLNGV